MWPGESAMNCRNWAGNQGEWKKGCGANGSEYEIGWVDSGTGMVRAGFTNKFSKFKNTVGVPKRNTPPPAKSWQ